MQSNKIFIYIYCKIYIADSPDDVYQIPNYLKVKHSGETCTKNHTGTKQNMKAMITDIREILESSGWQIIK